MNPATLLPHSGRALLLTRVLSHTSETLDAEATIPDAYPLARDGQAPCFVGIEVGAQAAAALEALSRTPEPRPSGGRLVRVDAATFSCGTLPTRAPIEVTVDREALLLPLAKYRVEIRALGRPCMQATISIFLLG